MTTDADRRELLLQAMRDMQRCEAYGCLWRDVDKLRREQKEQLQYCKRCRRNRLKPAGELAAVEDTGW